jgi:hypothetical protein
VWRFAELGFSLRTSPPLSNLRVFGSLQETVIGSRPTSDDNVEIGVQVEVDSGVQMGVDMPRQEKEKKPKVNLPSFVDLKIQSFLYTKLPAMGILRPTPVQRAAIPVSNGVYV